MNELEERIAEERRNLSQTVLMRKMNYNRLMKNIRGYSDGISAEGILDDIPEIMSNLDSLENRISECRKELNSIGFRQAHIE